MSKQSQVLLALLIAASLAGCASSPGQESTGEYIDDAAITSRIKGAFVKDEDVSAMQIGVETYKGHVQLSGFASTPLASQRAETIARDTPGVKSVDNDIRIKSP